MNRPIAVAVGSLLGVPASLAAFRYRNVIERQSKLPSTALDIFKSPHPAQTSDASPVRVIIIGGGVVGITAAYKMAQSGKQVVVLEPRSEPGKECSSCAAGGMQRSNPVVDRGTWVAVLQSMFPLPTWLGGSGETYRFFHLNFAQTLTDPFFLRWIATFTQTSIFPDSHQQDKREEQLKFTNYAVKEMVAMMENKWDSMFKVSGYNSNGSINVSYDPPVKPIEKSEDLSQNKSQEAKSGSPASGMSYEPSKEIIGDEILEVEPSLAWMEQTPTKAKFEHESKAANAERFTQELAKRCHQDKRLNVHLEYNTSVKAISTTEPEGDSIPRISHLHTNRGIIEIPSDVHVIIASGAWTSHIFSLMNLYAPVYPLKGYAMTVSASEALKRNSSLKAKDLPSRIVSDKYLYTSRLGDEIRITSIGEFSGWKTNPAPDVDAEFRREALSRMPQIADLINEAKTNCGHRPYVSDGLLLLGRVPKYDKVYVSVGPGSNGWKLAVGSGDIINRLVDGQSTAQIKEECGFDANALDPKGRIIWSPLFSKLCRACWDI